MRDQHDQILFLGKHFLAYLVAGLAPQKLARYVFHSEFFQTFHQPIQKVLALANDVFAELSWISDVPPGAHVFGVIRYHMDDLDI